MKNKYFVFSDIHGEYISLVDTLSKAGFEPDNPKHILICIGDGFDRGPDSRAIYELFVNCPRHIYVRGNHDNPNLYVSDSPLNKSNITVIEDYTLVNTFDKNVLCIGGAISIDRSRRTEGKSYWKNETVKPFDEFLS